GLLDRALKEPLVESLSDRFEHDLVELVLTDQQAIRADLCPAFVVVVAAVESPALAGPFVVPGERDERAAARGARGQPAQQVLLLVRPVRGPPTARVDF